jgi:LPS export ABC transporter protein LptC
LNTETKDMKARSNVVVVSEDGGRLETESLDWSQDTRLISTDDPVRVTQEGKVIHGIGLVSDPSLTDVTIRNPTGVFRDVDVPGEE